MKAAVKAAVKATQKKGGMINIRGRRSGKKKSEIQKCTEMMRRLDEKKDAVMSTVADLDMARAELLAHQNQFPGSQHQVSVVGMWQSYQSRGKWCQTWCDIYTRVVMGTYKEATMVGLSQPTPWGPHP